MLLRLIPLPTASTPAPPTILFTLPTPLAGASDLAPHNPYKPHSLPAPPALSTHNSVCKAASLPCPTLMAGESSTWINTIVQEVTFLPTLGEIQVLLVDGSGVVIPLRQSGAGKALDQVRDHVIESGRLMERAAKAAAQNKVAATEAGSGQGSSARPALRKGESLLMSFFSPLIGSKKDEDKVAATIVGGSVVGRELSARQHRRLARSELVDCYRRWVLNGLKSLLPPTYLLFSAQSMIQTHHQSLVKTEAELRVLLSIAGQLPATPPASPVLDKDGMPSPVAQSSTLPFPPASALPSHLRLAYVNHLSAHTSTQCSISSLEKLIKKHEREERRNRWDDSLPAIQKRHRPMPSPVVAVGSPLKQAWVAVPNPTQPGASYLVAYESSGMPPLSPSGSSWSSSCSSWGSDAGDDTEVVDAARIESGDESSEDEAYDGFTIEDQIVRISQKTSTGTVQGLGIGAVY